MPSLRPAATNSRSGRSDVDSSLEHAAHVVDGLGVVDQHQHPPVPRRRPAASAGRRSRRVATTSSTSGSPPSGERGPATATTVTSVARRPAGGGHGQQRGALARAGRPRDRARARPGRPPGRRRRGRARPTPIGIVHGRGARAAAGGRQVGETRPVGEASAIDAPAARGRPAGAAAASALGGRRRPRRPGGRSGRAGRCPPAAPGPGPSRARPRCARRSCCSRPCRPAAAPSRWRTSDAIELVTAVARSAATTVYRPTSGPSANTRVERLPQRVAGEVVVLGDERAPAVDQRHDRRLGPRRGRPQSPGGGRARPRRRRMSRVWRSRSPASDHRRRRAAAGPAAPSSPAPKSRA